MSISIIAEHDNTSLKSATLNTIRAGLVLGSDITLIVLGSGSEAVALEASTCEGVTKVIHGDDGLFEHPFPESWVPTLMEALKGSTHILVPSTTFGKNILPRLAAKLDMAQITDVIEIKDSSTFVRPIYAGNALSTVNSSDSIKLMTIRTTAFAPVSREGGKAQITKITAVKPTGPVPTFVKLEASTSERPELTSAQIVVSGGRALQSRENFQLIEGLADCLGGAVGASRAAVDAGYVPNDYQVGQTGKIVAPNLYIAIGISGAIQHLAGMKDSKVIVAINKDPDAPIFQVADYGLVGDLFTIVPELTQKLGCS